MDSIVHNWSLMDERLIDLEMKLSHQEIAVDELKQALYEQHQRLEKIEKDYKRLTERMQSLDSAPAVGPGNEKPPHY